MTDDDSLRALISRIMLNFRCKSWIGVSDEVDERLVKLAYHKSQLMFDPSTINFRE